ncbi:MAG TPA: hypothetical protein VHY48_08660 [Acidobacteriaceae bacterium]|jgi:hypothetical protein|nr:hypothetical protein [Acidobacteriaceae bacterium]
MGPHVWLQNVSIAECATSFCVLGVMFYKRLGREFAFLMALIGLRAISGAILIPLLFFRREIGLNINLAYDIYFFVVWISAVLQALLFVAIIYSVYRKAMEPLKGLQRIGNVIFRWVAVVAIAVSVAISVAPHLASFGLTSTTVTITALAGQIQQGTSVLTLCLLLFVCFAIRPLGLTFRSRIFGVTLGLGVTATTCIVQAAWFSTVGAHSLYSPIYLVSAVGSFATICVWGIYFILPEPERKMILLPTTSPFFTWNRISEALGDEPGFVAVAGFKPDMLAPAELKVFSSSAARADRLPSPPVQQAEPAAQRILHSIAVSQ